MNSYRRPVKFKRSRIPRRHSKLKIKPNSAVLFVVIFMIAVITATVMFGNYLKTRVDDTKTPAYTDSDTTSAETELKSDGISSITPADGSIRSGCLDITDYESEEALRKQIGYIFAAGYDSVTLPISDEGSLLYYSPAAIALSHIQSDAALPELSAIINTIREVGGEYGISPTVTAYYELTLPETDDPVLTEAAFLFDTAIVAEAYTLGADEVLVSGFTLADSADCDNITAFIKKAKTSASDIKLGLAFFPEVYAADTSASYLEKISADTAFFAVRTDLLDWSYSVTEETVITTDENGDETENAELVVHSVIYDELVSTAAEIKGSISLYGLRFLLNGDNAYSLAMATEALYFKGAYDHYVISSPPSGHVPDDYIPETETDAETEDKPDEETKKPPKPETTEKTETTQPPVTTETPETSDTAETTETTAPDAESDTTESAPPATETSPEVTTSAEDTTVSDGTTSPDDTAAPDETTAAEETTGPDTNAADTLPEEVTVPEVTTEDVDAAVETNVG